LFREEEQEREVTGTRLEEQEVAVIKYKDEIVKKTRSKSVTLFREEEVTGTRTEMVPTTETRQREVRRERPIVSTRIEIERMVGTRLVDEVKSDIEVRTRMIPVEKFMTIEHEHSHDSGDNRDSGSDVETVMSMSSISSVSTHSHGTSDEDEMSDHSGITSDGPDHIRGDVAQEEDGDIANIFDANHGSPDHEVPDSASDTDSLTDHNHDENGMDEFSDDNSGDNSFGGDGASDSNSTFEHSHDSISSVSGRSGDSSDDNHFHYIRYDVMVEEEYEHRIFVVEQREEEFSFDAEIEVPYSDVESYLTMEDYDVEILVPMDVEFTETQMVPYVDFVEEEYDAMIQVPYMEPEI
jgi:hypothetical protein